MEIGIMTKELALVVPYFGVLPEYTKIFFHSLRYNTSLDLILITDKDIDIQLENLIIVKKSFSDFKEDIQKQFNFKIALETPYKLCDYKVTYGMILEDMLSSYKYWGYCDLDMVLGDIFEFLPSNIDQFEKLYQYGHLTIFKNNYENNRRFMLQGGLDYKDVFTTNIIKVFDEVEGIQKKYELLGFTTYTQRDCADITPWKNQLKRVETGIPQSKIKAFNFDNQLFFWENGKIFRGYIDPNTQEIKYDTFNYLHFQKRPMKINFDLNENTKSFFITSDGIFEKNEGFNLILEDFKKYNSYDRLKEVEKRVNYQKYIWIRRFRKYFLKR